MGGLALSAGTPNGLAESGEAEVVGTESRAAPSANQLNAAAGQSISPALPWQAFARVQPDTPNWVVNPGLEIGPPGEAPGWIGYGSGFVVDPDRGRDGGRAILLVNEPLSETHGATQVIDLNQAQAHPILFSGWAKVLCVTGVPDIHFSVYLDVELEDGTWLYGQTLQFPTCPQGWVYREGYVCPEKPIRRVHFYTLLRWTHVGQVLFDDLGLYELSTDLLLTACPSWPNNPIPFPMAASCST